MNEQAQWISQLKWSVTYRGRLDLEAGLMTLVNQGQVGESHHWPREGRRSGERKQRLTFYPQKAKTNGLQSNQTRPTSSCNDEDAKQNLKTWSVHFWEQRRELSLETGRSVYGPFRELICHLVLNLKLNNRCFSSGWYVTQAWQLCEWHRKI